MAVPLAGHHKVECYPLRLLRNHSYNHPDNSHQVNPQFPRSPAIAFIKQVFHYFNLISTHTICCTGSSTLLASANAMDGMVFEMN